MSNWIGIAMVVFLLICALSLFSIAGSVSLMLKRVEGTMLAVQELCDRIWELGKEN